MIQILVKEMCNISLQGWKGNAIPNFKIVNATNSKLNLKKLLKYGISVQLNFNY